MRSPKKPLHPPKVQGHVLGRLQEIYYHNIGDLRLRNGPLQELSVGPDVNMTAPAGSNLSPSTDTKTTSSPADHKTAAGGGSGPSTTSPLTEANSSTNSSEADSTKGSARPLNVIRRFGVSTLQNNGRRLLESSSSFNAAREMGFINQAVAQSSVSKKHTVSGRRKASAKAHAGKSGGTASASNSPQAQVRSTMKRAGPFRLYCRPPGLN